MRTSVKKGQEIMSNQPTQPNNFENTDQVLAEVMNIMMDAKSSLGDGKMPEVYNKVLQLMKELSGFE